MIPSFDPALWRRASWTVFSLSIVAFICLGLAEQGSRGGGLLTPPDSPLPFARHRIFGLDLSEMSSLQALDWLNAAGNPSLPLILVPVDADVVESLAQEEQRETALTAITTLRQASGDSPLAVCLRRPPDMVGGLGIAQAAVGAIRSRFPDQVVYIRACQPNQNAGWQSNIDEAVRPDAEIRVTDDALIPMAGSDVILLERLNSQNDLAADQFRLRSRGSYSMFVLEVTDPLSSSAVEDAADAMANTSHSALIMISPAGSVDPAALVGSISAVVLAGDALPEGFSSVDAPAMVANDQWQRTNVGTVSYLRAPASTAALSADFVGTDVYLMAIESPESGVVYIWIDPQSRTAPPTVILDLESFQARDAAIPIATGLPAARHEMIVQAVVDEGESVTISGLFVTGTPATAWTGTMAASVVFLAAILALSERCYTAVATIRRRTGPPRRRARPGHPRVFARDR